MKHESPIMLLSKYHNLNRSSTCKVYSMHNFGVCYKVDVQNLFKKSNLKASLCNTLWAQAGAVAIGDWGIVNVRYLQSQILPRSLLHIAKSRAAKAALPKSLFT